MKFSRVAIAAAIYGVLCAGSANAQGVRQPVAQRASYSDYYSGQQGVPGEVVPYESTGGGMEYVEEAVEEEEEEDRWYLLPQFGNWRLHGYVNAGATANADSPVSHYNGPTSFNDREVGRLHQLYGILEKPVDTGGCGFDWGARVDLMFGTDYIFTQATGLETRQNGAAKWNGVAFGGGGPGFAEYGLAMPQAYLDLGYNDLTVKVGHFYAPIGYQGVMATNNFYISQPYVFQYGEPFTFTGVLGSYAWSDETTLVGGVVNGWDKFDAVTDKLALVWGYNHNPSHGKYTVNSLTVLGQEDGTTFPGTPVSTRILNSWVFTYNFSECLQYVFQNDVGWQDNGAAIAGSAAGGDSEWYGINNYLFYTINDCWKVGLRGEWFRDDDGVRLANAPIRLGGAANAAALAGLAAPNVDQIAGHYFQVAPGINWTPTSNLIVRSEVRWDWSGGTAIQPYDDFTKDSQFLAAVDAIVLW